MNTAPTLTCKSRAEAERVANWLTASKINWTSRDAMQLQIGVVNPITSPTAASLATYQAAPDMLATLKALMLAATPAPLAAMCDTRLSFEEMEKLERALTVARLLIKSLEPAHPPLTPDTCCPMKTPTPEAEAAAKRLYPHVPWSALSRDDQAYAEFQAHGIVNTPPDDLVWLTNNPDHREPGAEARHLYTPQAIRAGAEAMRKEWEEEVAWAEAHIIGRPQATVHYSVGDLEAMGLIGIYKIATTSTP